jgi:hypothetical protein
MMKLKGDIDQDAVRRLDVKLNSMFVSRSTAVKSILEFTTRSLSLGVASRFLQRPSSLFGWTLSGVSADHKLGLS